MAETLELEVLGVALALCRLDPGAGTPAWARGPFVAVTRTPDELSVVCEEAGVPDGMPCEPGLRALRVRGPLSPSAIGILAALAVPLADARIWILAIATYDTDYILMRDTDLARARVALEGAGHVVRPRQDA